VTFPQNTIEVYAELYASGNGDEEFWVRVPLLFFFFWHRAGFPDENTVLQHR
jgi:hypothetical protein